MSRNTYIVLILSIIGLSTLWGIIEAISGNPFDAAVTVYAPILVFILTIKLGEDKR